MINFAEFEVIPPQLLAQLYFHPPIHTDISCHNGLITAPLTDATLHEANI